MNLTLEECNLAVKCGDDGVWLNFSTKKGLKSSIHVGNNLVNGGGGIVNQSIENWIIERQEQYKKAKENGYNTDTRICTPIENEIGNRRIAEHKFKMLRDKVDTFHDQHWYKRVWQAFQGRIL